ncbi:MAG: stage III sporulation protein AC/AD protein family [Oscillospiraceae bacterium]|jgi:stage III sporulation protein AD|nr:stage III sporulation protein AC/AD protein family [Oscillospiraceae bacterium]
MNIYTLAAVGIVTAVLISIVGQHKPEFKIYLSVAASVLIVAAALPALSPVLTSVREFADKAGLSGVYLGTLLKCLAVCYIGGIAADICRDAGETAIASKLDLAGKIAITALSLPLWKDLLDLVITLAEQ